MYYQKPRYQEEELPHSKCEDAKQPTDGGSVVVCSPSLVPSGKNLRCGYYLMCYATFLRNLYVKGRISFYFCIEEHELFQWFVIATEPHPSKVIGCFGVTAFW